MSQQNIQRLSVDALVKLYRTEASSHGKTSFEGDYKSANMHHDVVASIYRELRSRGQGAQFALLDLLDDEDPNVRVWAAAHALEFAPQKGEPVLVELSRSARGLSRLNAEMTLQEWKRGSLQFP